MPEFSQLSGVSSWTRADLWGFLPPLLGLGHTHVVSFLCNLHLHCGIVTLSYADAQLWSNWFLRVVMRNHHTLLIVFFFFSPLGRKAQKSIFDHSDRSCCFVRAHKFVHALQHSSSNQRCWKMLTYPALAQPSYGAVVLEFVKLIFKAVLCLLPGSGALTFSSSLPDEELHSMSIESVFNKRCLGVGSSGFSCQQ